MQNCQEFTWRVNINVIQSIRELHQSGVQDNIIVGFDLVTDKVRNVKNADIIATLTDSPYAVTLRKGIRISDDPNAPVYRLETETPPLRYADLRAKAKEKKPDMMFGGIFNLVMQKIKANPEFCQVRYLDPKNCSGIKKVFYTELAVDNLVKLYEEMEQLHGQ